MTSRFRTLAATIAIASLLGVAADAAARGGIRATNIDHRMTADRPVVRDHRLCAPTCVTKGNPRPGQTNTPSSAPYPTPPVGYHPPK